MESLTQREKMDFVTCSLAPNSNILLLSGSCIVSHSRMLILLIFSVPLCKDQITKQKYQVLKISQRFGSIREPLSIVSSASFLVHIKEVVSENLP